MNRLHFFFCALLATSFSFAQGPNVEYLDENKDIIYDLDMADSTRLVALASDYIATWDLSKKSIIHKYNAPGANLTCLDVSASGDLTAFGNKQGDVTIIRTGTSEVVYNRSGVGVVTDIKFSANDSLVAVTYYSGFFVVSELATKSAWEYNIPVGHAISCGLSESGQFMAVGDDKGKVRIFSLLSHSGVNEYQDGNSLIKEIIWTDEDTKMITATRDGNIQTCHNPTIPGRQALSRHIRNQGTISGAGYNKETKSTCCCTLEGSVKINFDLGSYKYKEAVAMHAVCALPAESVYTRLAVATNGKGIILVDSRNMKLNKN